MKNNLISGIASWKSAALLAIVAMVAAVAFSGVLSTTKTAEAVLGAQVGGNVQTEVAPGTTVAVSTSPTVDVTSGDYVNWTITTTGDAKATFAASDSGTLTCQDATTTPSACDANGSATEMTVNVKIADDSGKGAVLVRASKFGGAATDADQVVLTVNPGLTPTAIKITPPTGSIPATAGTLDLTITVTNSTGGGVATPVDLITTLGQFTGSGGCTNAGQACSVTTVAATGQPGTAPQLGSLRQPGKATVTATVRGTTLKATAEITFFGAAANISAVPEQGAIQIGGKTRIVVTVTDAAGSPFAGHQLTDSDVVPGPVATPVKLSAMLGVPKDLNQDGDTADKDDIPHCDDSTPETPTEVTDPASYAAGGTNAAGQCVIEVMAPVDPNNPLANATRGAHEIKVALSGTTKSATATVNVGGPPSSISSDAPDSVEPLSETVITVTVLDDEGIAVGEVTLDIDLISPQGLITSNPTTTKDGKAKFSYIAALGGEAVFRVAAGTPGVDQITDSITITVGEAAPAGPAPTWSETPTSGTHNLVWNGEDGPASDGAVEGLVAIWRWENGQWLGYVPGLADNLSELENGKAYWVVVE